MKKKKSPVIRLSNVDFDSIMAKAAKCMNSAKKKKEADRIIDNHMLGKELSIGGLLSGIPTLRKTASNFRRVLQESVDEAAGANYAGGELGPTAVEALKDVFIEDGEKSSDGRYIAKAYYQRGALYRDSLQPNKYDGVYDLSNLLNKGYSTDGLRRVRGVWNGHGDGEIWSLPSRAGSHFIDRAIESYMHYYALKSGVIGIIYNGDDN